MHGRIVFLIFLFSMAFAGFALNDTSVESQTTSIPQQKSPLPNKPADVVSVSLNRQVVSIPCANINYYPKEVREKCPDDGLKVEATAVAKDEEGDVLTYEYTVSSGRIVGTGAKVVWDLTGVLPGTYTITVGVADGCGFCGTTRTETVAVERCDCYPIDVFCICPSFDVKTSKESVKAGETIVFSLNFDVKTNAAPVKYKWTLSGGTIVEGQGAPSIKVKTTRASAGSLLTATVDFYYEGICDVCLRNDSESVRITKR